MEPAYMTPVAWVLARYTCTYALLRRVQPQRIELTTPQHELFRSSRPKRHQWRSQKQSAIGRDRGNNKRARQSQNSDRQSEGGPKNESKSARHTTESTPKCSASQNSDLWAWSGKEQYIWPSTVWELWLVSLLSKRVNHPIAFLLHRRRDHVQPRWGRLAPCVCRWRCAKEYLIAGDRITCLGHVGGGGRITRLTEKRDTMRLYSLMHLLPFLLSYAYIPFSIVLDKLLLCDPHI